MEGHPLHGHPFGLVGIVTPKVDLWVKGGRLPARMRAVPKPDGRLARPYTTSRR
jgi:hypothetical protein